MRSGFEVWDVASMPLFPNQENNAEFTARPVLILEDLVDHYQYTLTVIAGTPEAIEMGLSFTSLIVLDRLVYLKKSRLHLKYGHCPDIIIEKVEELLELKKNAEIKP